MRWIGNLGRWLLEAEERWDERRWSRENREREARDTERCRADREYAHAQAIQSENMRVMRAGLADAILAISPTDTPLSSLEADEVTMFKWRDDSLTKEA